MQVVRGLCLNCLKKYLENRWPSNVRRAVYTVANNSWGGGEGVRWKFSIENIFLTLMSAG